MAALLLSEINGQLQLRAVLPPLIAVMLIRPQGLPYTVEPRFDQLRLTIAAASLIAANASIGANHLE